MALSSILAPPSDRDDPRALPKAAGAQANVLLVKERADRKGITGDWACAQGLSRRWGARAAPRLVMPCLLHSNSAGYWLGSRGRHATVAEHARAQGLEHGSCTWPSDPTAFALLGNSMARCILQRLLHRILCSWGVFKGQTPGCGGKHSTAFVVRPWRDLSPPPGRLPPWLVEPRRLGRRFRASSFHPPEGCRTSMVGWKACGSTIGCSWARLAALTIPAQRRRPRLRVPTEPRRGSLVRSPWEVAVASTRKGPLGPGGRSGRGPTPARAWGCLPWLRVLTEPWRGGLARPPWEAAVVRPGVSPRRRASWRHGCCQGR